MDSTDWSYYVNGFLLKEKKKKEVWHAFRTIFFRGRENLQLSAAWCGACACACAVLRDAFLLN